MTKKANKKVAKYPIAEMAGKPTGGAALSSSNETKARGHRNSVSKTTKGKKK